jgi:hypothetical protein
MRFHLPAYIIVDLEGTLEPFGITHDIVFHLCYECDDRQSKFGLLNPLQRRAIREYLLLRRREYEDDDIDHALQNYWTLDTIE